MSSRKWLWLGLLAALPAFAAAPGTKTSDDEDEDEAPKVETPKTPEKPSDKPLAPAENKTTAQPAAAPAGDAAIANPLAQRLVSGAPLYNPNVAVHIVEKKQFTDRSHSEVVLFPATPQINGKFTQHYGTALQYVYHLHENFALQATGQYNWYSSESGFNEELINKVREQAQAATSLLMVWGALGGVEVAPLYGKFAYYEGRLGHFSIVLNAGAGVAGTRLQLRAANDAGPDTFGDAGLKFMGSVGGGFRVLLGDRFALRLEVRDLVYTARVDAIDGCNAGDLAALDQWFHNHPSGAGINTVQVGGGCNVNSFTGQVVKGDGSPPNGYTYDHSADIPLAYNLVASPSSDVLNNVSFYLGLSFIF